MAKKKIPAFALGQKVKISGTVAKTSISDAHVTHTKQGLPKTTSMYRDDPANQPDRWVNRVVKYSEGIIVGRRTIADHRIDGGWDESTSATPIPGTQRTAWLVSWHLDRRPVMALTEQITALPEA